MKLAALILVHRYAEQAELLVNTLLQYNKMQVYIHVDLKAPDVYTFLQQCFGSNSRVVIISERYKVFWGSYQQIKATAALMQSANEHKPDYAFLLSGQDFPIHPLSEFAGFLEKNPTKNYLVHFALPDAQWDGGGLHRLQYFHFDSENHPWLIRKITAAVHRLQNIVGYKRAINFKLYGGSNWFTITGAALNTACNKLNTQPKFIRQFSYSRCADEIFLQSLLVTELAPSDVVNADLRMIDWSTGPEYPRIWRLEDYDRLTTNTTAFFARKFDASVDSDILRKLQAHVTK